MIMGPSLYGMGVSVTVGVTLGVKVSLGKGVFVDVLMGIGVTVVVDVRVRVGVNVSVMVGVELANSPRTAGLEEKSQLPTTTMPNTKLKTQNPVTILPRDFDEGAGIICPHSQFDVGYRMRY